MAKGDVLFFLGLAAVVGFVIFLSLKPETTQSRDETITDSKIDRLMLKQGSENPTAPNNSKRYQNKENRNIKLGYNEDGLLSSIDMEITRDYTIA